MNIEFMLKFEENIPKPFFVFRIPKMKKAFPFLNK